MRDSYNKNRKNLLIICPILNLQGCKDIVTKVLCNDLYEVTPKCIMVKNMEKFIETNEFNLQENIAITRTIFDFVSHIPIVGNMQSIKKMFEPTLRPPGIDIFAKYLTIL